MEVDNILSLCYGGIRDGRYLPQFMFDANHFHKETTLDTTDSDKFFYDAAHNHKSQNLVYLMGGNSLFFNICLCTCAV